MFPRLTNKKQSLIFYSVLFVLLWQLQLFATPLRPICIYFPGNFAGNAITLSEKLDPMPGSCWKTPSMLGSFTRNNSFKHIIAGPGNNYSMYKPVSFLADGKFTRQIINQSNCALKAVSPQDLLQHRNTRLSHDIRKHLLTNIEPSSKDSIFPDYHVQNTDGLNIWFFNFISIAQLKRLPLQNWGQIKPEDPCRALRRISPPMGSNDIAIAFAYLNKDECFKLAEEFKNFPGHHIIVQVVDENIQPDFSLYAPGTTGNSFIFSLKDGHLRLPFLKIHRRSNGFLRLTLRRLPYEKAKTYNSLMNFSAIRDELGKMLYETLALVPPQIQASTTPFRFVPQLHARFAKSQAQTDFAMIYPPEEKFKNDNVIDAVQCLSSFANEKLYRGQISGRKLQKLLTEITKNVAKPPVFYGISFHIFAGQAEKIKINRKELEPNTNYSFCINERMQKILESLGLLDRQNFEPFAGITLWDVWKTQLKSLRIKRTDFLEH